MRFLPQRKGACVSGRQEVGSVRTVLDVGTASAKKTKKKEKDLTRWRHIKS
jgi:hypothetical protein